jgi:hypothetical protein
MVSGFEEYLSGYPIPGEKAYAFVKTWYAPEMERPGCVWSHVLVIPNPDIANFNEFSELVPVFKRPQDAKIEGYTSQVELELGGFSPMQLSDVQGSDVESVIHALYNDQAEKPVIIPAIDARVFEGLILSIWSQQWPALRSSFRFSSGSLSARNYAGRPFDLQVVPFRLFRELQRDPSAFVIVTNAEQERVLNDVPTWVSAGSRDLRLGGGWFREFLKTYADNDAEIRSDYSKLGTLFTFFEKYPSGPEISELTRKVTDVFPEQEKGGALKYELYGPADAPDLRLPFLSEETRLLELANTSQWHSFNAIQLRVRARAKNLWDDNPAHGKMLLLGLLDASINNLGDEIVRGFSEAVSAAEACEIAQDRPGVLLAILIYNPRLVTTEQFWHCKLPVNTYYLMFDFLKTNMEVSPTSWIPYFIDGGAPEIAGALVERFARETVGVFMERALRGEERSSWIPEKDWRAALAGCQNELLAYVNSAPFADSVYALALLAGLLDAHRHELNFFGYTPWIKLVRTGIDIVFQFPNAEAAGFLLSFAFQHTENEALELIRSCFEFVHASARDDSSDPLSYRTWRSLEVDLPALSRSRNWDKCERLRQGLVRRFVSNSWPGEELFRCVSNPTTLRSTLYSFRDVRGGEEYITDLAEKALGGFLNATEPQVEVLRAAFRRNWRGDLKLDL